MAVQSKKTRRSPLAEKLAKKSKGKVKSGNKRLGKNRYVDQGQSFILWILKQTHQDYPRKIVISLFVFLMIYFTTQIDQGWSREVIGFVERMTTEQPNYREVFNQFSEGYEEIQFEEWDILPVISEEQEKEPF